MKGRVAFGTNVYPSVTAGRGERLGRTPFRRCIQCGLFNDTRKIAFGEGDGLNEIDDPSNPGKIDRIVTSGCRFCGSRKWLKRKPSGKFPDASRIPADPKAKFQQTHRMNRR